MVRPALAGCGPAGHVLDIGCGVGGTALWLAQELGVQVTGVTNSPLQARLAGERAQRLAQVGCRFLVGDFHALPALGPLDATYAIEAFVHARQASIFFEQAAAQPSRRAAAAQQAGLALAEARDLTPTCAPLRRRCWRR
jgi:cyclopropane fatty-acyl-phospholipid synthase-like methyltransferase